MSSRTVTLALLVLSGALVLALELLGRRTGRVPTLAALAGALCRRTAGRVALFLVWAWSGWHFFAR